MKNNKITNNYLKKVVGPDNLENTKKVIKKLGTTNKTDKEICEKINKKEIKLETVRNLLYKLHDASIANYKRNKDPETQWFTYTWRFDKEEYVKRIIEFYTTRLEHREAELYDLENNLYFVCCMDPEHFKGDYTESSEYEFYCPVCDYELEPFDAKKDKTLLKRRITVDKKNFKKFEEAIEE